MLKSMLFGGTSGSGSWVLQFNEEGLILNDICIDENGPLYVAGEAYRYFSTNSKVKNIFSARIENTGIVSWQNYFGDNTNNEGKQSENGHIAIINGEILVGGNEIVNNSLVGTQLCLYSVNGEKLHTKKIYCTNNTNFGNISTIKPYNNSNSISALVCGDYSVQMRLYSTGIYPYDGVTNYSPNKIIDAAINRGSRPDSYLCIQDVNSNLLIYATQYNPDGSSSYWTNIIREKEDRKIKGTGICVHNDIFFCGTTDKYEYTRGIVARYSTSSDMYCRWIQEISGNGPVYCCGIDLDIDRNSYVVGNSSDLGFLIKLSLYGVVLLNIKITGDEYTVKSVKVDTKGNVYLLMPKHIVKLTKDDIESVIASPLSIGPLTFTKGSLNISYGSAYANGYSRTTANNNTYDTISSTFISREANLTSNLYKG